MNNADAIGVSIAAQCKILKEALGDVASQEQGICLIAENITEQIWGGFNNVVGPKILITFVGEDIVGDESVSELVGHVRRHFDILVQRGKVMTNPPNTTLTETVGPSKPFYDLLELIRDTARSIIWPSPMVTNPTEYASIRPASNENWMFDSYIISISTIVDIGRVQVNPPELATTPYVQLEDPMGVAFNKSH
jgi:hypothetical protein